MYYYPNTSYYFAFTTNDADGTARDADALPVATATRNGVDDAAFVLTVTKIDTGRYKITGTVPAGYAADDIVQVSVAATVDTVAAKAVVHEFRVVSAVRGTAGTRLDAAMSAIPSAVWDEPIAGHLAAGSTGAALNASGAAGDPWASAVPGAYAPGTAGHKLGLIGTVGATVSVPLVAATELLLVRGDDYKADNGRAIDFTFPNAPDLTGATVALKAVFSGSTVTEISMSVIAADTVRLELEGADTASLTAPATYRYDIEAELATSGHVVTLVNKGKLRLEADVR